MRRAHTPPTNRKITVAKSSLKGLLKFGEDNLLPQLLAEIVKTSVTASRCHNVRTKFIKGNGFNDVAFSERIVHRSGLTMDDVLDAIAKNASMYNVVCLHVQYNALGYIVGIRPVGVELVRLGEPDADGVIRRAGICNYLNSTLHKSKRNEYTEINLFDPRREVVLAQIEASGGINAYNGQLIYQFTAECGDEYYHEPDYFSCIKDMEAEAGLSIYDFSTVQNGFNVSGFFAYLSSKKTNVSNYDPYANPDSVEYQIAQNQGPQKAGAMMTMACETVEELDSIKFISTQGDKLSERYVTTTDRVEQRIARAMGTPLALVNIHRQNGLAPSDKELITASRFMFFVVNEWQRLIIRVLKTVFTNWYQGGPVPPLKIENLDTFMGVDLTQEDAAAQPVATPQAN